MGVKPEKQTQNVKDDRWTVVIKKAGKKSVAEQLSPNSKTAPYDILEAPPGMEKHSQDDKITAVRRASDAASETNVMKDSKRSSDTSSKVLVSFPSMRSSRDYTTTSDSNAPSVQGFGRQTHSRRNSRSRMYPGPQPCTNVEALRHCVKMASAGTGEILHILETCTFAPREAAFTKLISECGSDIGKARELWSLMRSNIGLRPNTISYSALINVCARARDWAEAEKVFTSQIQEATRNIDCRPNHISYSNMISACLKANRVGRALSWYSHMTQAGIEGDGLLQSNMLTACVETKQSMDTVLNIMEQMHLAGFCVGPEIYAKILHRLATEGVCTWNEAVEIFICASMAGAEPDAGMCHALLEIFDQQQAAQPAVQLLEECLIEGMDFVDVMGMVTRVLQLCSRLGKGELAMSLWVHTLEPRGITSADIARLVLEATENDTLRRGVSTPRIKQLTASLRSFSSLPV